MFSKEPSVHLGYRNQRVVLSPDRVKVNEVGSDHDPTFKVKYQYKIHVNLMEMFGMSFLDICTDPRSCVKFN